MKIRILIIMLILSTMIFTTCNKPDPETTGILIGLVTNSKSTTNEPVAGATVTISPNNSTIQTDNQGKFEFKDLQPTSYTITITKDGFKSATKQIAVNIGNNTTDIALNPIEYGKISGTITDASNNQVIQATITINPTNKTINTGTDGKYLFENLEPQDYTLTITKSDYNNKTETVTVTANQTVTKDIGLTPVATSPTIHVSTTLLDFSTTLTTMPFNITNTGNGTLDWQVAENIVWLSVNPSSGTTTTETDGITVTIDENQLPNGQQEQSIVITSTNGGSETITIKIQGKSAPTIEIGTATNITENSITVSGNLTSLGARINNVMQHGFCYSTINQHPTITDSKLELSSTSQTGNFSGVINNLQPEKTYYIRAFATNSVSTSYSEPPSLIVKTKPIILYGLIAYYPFNGNANDESGNGINGIVYGASLTNDRLGNANSAYSFNGTNNYIGLTTSSYLKPQNAFTISTWIFLASNANTIQRIFDNQSELPWYGYGLYIQNNKITLEVYTNSNTSVISNTLNSNQWYHVIAQYDINNLKIYINGIFITSTSCAGNINYTNVINPPRIGSRSTINGGNFFNGKIDDIRFYNRALTESEIQQLYQQ